MPEAFKSLAEPEILALSNSLKRDMEGPTANSPSVRIQSFL